MEQGFEHKQVVSGANTLNHYMVLPLRKRPDCSYDLACVWAPFSRCGFRYPHYFDHPLLDELQFLFIIHKPTELPPKNPAVQTACVQYYTMSVSLWITYWVSHTDSCLSTNLQTMKSPILLTCAIKSSLSTIPKAACFGHRDRTLYLSRPGVGKLLPTGLIWLFVSVNKVLSEHIFAHSFLYCVWLLLHKTRV